MASEFTNWNVSPMPDIDMPPAGESPSLAGVASLRGSSTSVGKFVGTGGGSGKLVGLVLVQREMCCMGYIGNARSKVCLGPKDCEIKSHDREKYAFPDGVQELVFIGTGGINATAWASPSVELSLFGATWERYCSEARSITQWQTFLEAMSTGRSVTERDVDRMGDATLTAKEMFTPFKRRKVEAEDASLDGSVLSYQDVNSQSYSPLKAAEDYGLQWPTVARNFEYLFKMAQAAKKGNEEMEDTVADVMMRLEARIGELKALIGVRPPELGTSTLFRLAESQGEQVREMGTLYTSVEEGLTRLSSAGQPDLAGLKTSIKAEVYSDMGAALAPLRALFSKQSSDVRTPGDKLESELIKIKFELAQLEGRVQQQTQPGASMFHPLSPGLAWNVTIPTMTSPVNVNTNSAISMDIKALERKVLRLEQQLDTTAVKIGTKTFSSRQEADAWLKTNCPLPGAFTFFLDFHSLLALAFGPGVNMNDILKLQESSVKLSFASTEETIVASSFHLEIPAFFGKATTGATAMSAKVLPGLPTYAAWDMGDSDHGLRYDMKRKVKTYVEAWRASAEFSLTPDALVVAQSMLHASVAFVDQVSYWITEFFTDCRNKGANDGETWKHISHTIREICSILHDARKAGRGQATSPSERASGAFWGQLQAHQEMEILAARSLVSDPRLSHILNLHLRDNAVMRSELSKVNEAIKSLNKDMFDMKAKAKKTAVGGGPRGASVWSWFLERLGKISWTLVVDPQSSSLAPQLAKVLIGGGPQLVFLDEGVRLRSTSPLWYDRKIQLVVAVDIWRGSPPSEWWSCETRLFNHEHLGGVTNGHFHLHLAKSNKLAAEIRSELHPAVRAHFRHVLDPTRPGIRCPIPSEKASPLGQDEKGLLHWDRRLNNVEAPTVFSKAHWVKRRLSPKELCSVLDMPGEFMGRTKGQDVALLKVPGKVRAQLVENIRDCFEALGGKRRMIRPEGEVVNFKRAKPSGGNLVISTTSTTQTEILLQIAHDTVTVKSTKDDDASVPTYLWDNRCVNWKATRVTNRTDWIEALNVLREKLFLPFWKRKVARDFWDWVQGRDEVDWWIDANERRRSVMAGKKAIKYATQASWWEWDGGSFPFFWRWNLEFVREIRDGLAPRFTHNPPACMERQRPNANPEFAARERVKLFKVLKRGYLRPVTLDEIRSLMHYFSVPKGENDIRMVYDGSKCGLNAATFAPWFAVPTSSSLERTVMPHTVQGDNDFGDMFLNFQLHHEMQKYTGVDATDLLKDSEAVAWLDDHQFDVSRGVFLTWDRPAMGLTGSPYQSVQTGTRGKRLILGDPSQEANPFQWKEVVLNLPGDPGYDPRLPWLFKLRKDGQIAADLHTYIDDNRGTANDAEEAWRVSSRVAKTCSWLGMQDAARKRRAPSMTPGAWAGTIIRTDGTQAEKMVSQERWDKTKEKIGWIRDQLRAGQGEERVRIQHKRLESIRGFLVYVTRTYLEMVPYLKGIHLTLDSWRHGRARSGWKLKVAGQEEWEDEEQDGCALTNTIDDCIQPEELRGIDGSAAPPVYVVAVPRLSQDVETLYQLTNTAAPPIALVRPVKVMVGYLVGDASGSGHGSSFLYTGGKTLNLAHGTWSEEATQRSSNFRELANLVRRVEQLWKQGNLVRGTELFVFTDNFVTESVFYKGAASSPFLHNLVERLKMVQLHGGLFVHVLWIAGTRMIEQGTDGLSRGDFNSGVMAGKDFLSMIPLNQGALDLSPKLEHWIRQCFPGRLSWEVLTPAGWFSRGHEDGHFIWCPPPAVADAALEQMCESVLCRPWNAHVFVCPAHMTYKWRKQLRKVSDLVITVPVGGNLWPHCLHEPLVLGLTCPLLAYSPWRVKRSKRLAERQSLMPKVWSEDWEVEGDILRQLWTQEVPSDPNMLWGLASRVLHEKPFGQVPGVTSEGLGGLVDGA